MKGLLVCLLACTLVVGSMANIVCLAPQGSMAKYLQGVWDQLALEYDWAYFKVQIDKNASLDNDNLNLTGSGFADLNTNASNCTGPGCNQGPSDADILVRGIQKVSQVINQRFTLAGNNFLEVYNQQLIQWILGNFTNQTGGTFVPKSSIIIQGVQVWSHINESIVAWFNQSYYEAGKHLGMAMGLVFWRDNANSQAMADAINAAQSDWNATSYSNFASQNLWALKKAVLNNHEPFWANWSNGATSLTPPNSYDLRNLSAGCIHPIRDVGQCGSSWAFGAADVLADRFCLASNGTVNRQLSADYILSCSGYNNGCKGGFNDRAWNFLENAGDASETCRPYTSNNGVWSDNCTAASKCADGSNMAKYYAKANASKWFWGVASIKAEIWAHGPVQTSFSVWEDFLHYKSGIYHYVMGDFVGVASARLVGWGQENGTNYWIAANYWGESWGENGYFRVKENDKIYIDYAAVAGIPDIRTCAAQQ